MKIYVAIICLIYSMYCFSNTYDASKLKREYTYLNMRDANYSDSSESCSECLQAYSLTIDDGYTILFYYYNSIVPYPNKWCRLDGYENHRPHYFGYIDPRFSRYNMHFERQSKMLKKYRFCTCYWPEVSEAAGEISDMAYLFFMNILTRTELANLFKNCDFRRGKECTRMDCIQKYFTSTSYGLSLKEFIVSFIAQQFFFQIII